MRPPIDRADIYLNDGAGAVDIIGQRLEITGAEVIPIHPNSSWQILDLARHRHQDGTLVHVIDLAPPNLTAGTRPPRILVRRVEEPWQTPWWLTLSQHLCRRHNGDYELCSLATGRSLARGVGDSCATGLFVG